MYTWSRFHKANYQFNLTKEIYIRNYYKYLSQLQRTLTGGKTLPEKVSSWLYFAPKEATEYLLRNTLGKTEVGAKVISTVADGLLAKAEALQQINSGLNKAGRFVAETIQEVADAHQAGNALRMLTKTVEEVKQAKDLLVAALRPAEGVRDLAKLTTLIEDLNALRSAGKTFSELVTIYSSFLFLAPLLLLSFLPSSSSLLH